MFIYIIIFMLSIVSYIFLRRKKEHDLSNDHCLITGGTSGIGLALAIECAKLGASVTILARGKVDDTPHVISYTSGDETYNISKKKSLQEAKDIISSFRKNDRQKVSAFSVDITAPDTNLNDILLKAETNNGPFTFLFNCAGTSIAKRFDETPLQDFKDILNLNYIGSVSVTQAVLPYMKKRCHGRIVFVSSLAGLMGLYGYTAYSGSKFALVGLAEALQMELKPYNISITVSFPPDTATEGYVNEMKSKPLETAKISESGGLFTAELVAKKTLSDAINKKFMSSVGFEGWVLCTACCATTPVNSFVQLLIQVATMGLFRLGIFTFLLQFDRTVRACVKERCQVKREEKESTENVSK